MSKRTIRRLIIHCSASEMIADAATIRSFHVAKPPAGRGWTDIGYHYVITKNGTIEYGRRDEEIGAHCEGYNRDSIGICLGGLNNFTHRQIEACRYLVQEKMKEYGLERKDVVMHSELDLKGKICPNPIEVFRSFLTDSGGD